MTESKHTPGPWSVYPETDGTEICAVDMTPGLPIRQIVARPVRGENWQANARLIAAAPDLLSQLKRLVIAYVSLMESGRDRIIDLGGDCDPVDVMEAGNPHLRDVKAIIAKAEGRS